MKNLKFLLTLVSFFLVVGVISAQDSKMGKKALKKIEKRATKRVEKLNAQLLAIGEDLGLTEAQSKQAFEIYKEGFINIANATKGLETKEDKKAAGKPFRKSMNKAINADVLSKAQRKALKNAKKQKKMKKAERNH